MLQNNCLLFCCVDILIYFCILKYLNMEFLNNKKVVWTDDLAVLYKLVFIDDKQFISFRVHHETFEFQSENRIKEFIRLIDFNRIGKTLEKAGINPDNPLIISVHLFPKDIGINSYNNPYALVLDDYDVPNDLFEQLCACVSDFNLDKVSAICIRNKWGMRSLYANPMAIVKLNQDTISDSEFVSLII